MNQLAFTFDPVPHSPATIIQVVRKANNPESQKMNVVNEVHYNNQCTVVYDALKRGERLTTTSALLKYQVGDLRRRIADLIQLGVPVKKELINGRFKEYFL